MLSLHLLGYADEYGKYLCESVGLLYRSMVMCPFFKDLCGIQKMYGHMRGFKDEFHARITGIQVGNELLQARKGACADVKAVIDEALPHCK